MNILFITHCDPRDSSFGSAQRSHLLWKALQRQGNVYTVFAVGPLAKPYSDETARIKSFCFSPRGWLFLHLYGIFKLLFAPAEWPFRICSLKKRFPWQDVKFDRVVVRYMNGVARSQAWKLGPVYVDIDDLPTESYETVYRKQRGPVLGWIGSQVVSAWQTWLLGKCRAAWIASPAQVGEVGRVCPCKCLPNLALPPSEGYRIVGRQKRQLMTVGLMSYEPNYEGVDWFVSNVWPKIHAKCLDMTYAVCGGGTPARLKAKWSSIPGVEVRGFVKDLDTVYEESLAVVTPIMSGAGTCIKVMEAALHGRKIFATPFALRGMTEGDKNRLMIAEISDATVFAEKMVEYLKSDQDLPALQTKIAQEAKELNSFETFADCCSSLLDHD